MNHRALTFILVLAAALPVDAQTPEAVYDPTQVRILTLNLAPGDWNTIVNDPTFSIEVPAMFAEFGNLQILVSVRRKSATALGQKISLKIDINEYVAGQEWNGLKKLSLENGDDEDVISEGLGWLLHRLAAIQTGPAYKPGRAAWVALVVNGQYVGAYVNVEQPDKTFLKNRGMYVSGESWLYKVGDIGQAELKVGTPDSPVVVNLCFSPFESPTPCGGPAAALFDYLVSTLIDESSLMVYAAASAFHAGGDQLFSHGKNFYFIDRIGHQRSYIPWDLDSVFSGGGLNRSIYSNRQQPTAYETSILQNPTFQPLYDQTMANLLNGFLSGSVLVQVLDFLEQSTLLPLAVDLDPNNNLGEQTAAQRIQSLRNWVLQRDSSIRAELGI